MFWNEMIVLLQKSGVPKEILPVRGHAEARLGLYVDGDRFLVNLTERAETEDIAEFPTEELAVDFIYENEVFAHRLNGDTRFDKFNANPQMFSPPRAEDFGGKTLKR